MVARARRFFLRTLPVSVAFLVMVPALVALIKLVSGKTWYPTGDMAQAELHMRGFWSNPPLVGAAGRIESDGGVQGSHPGPALWVAMYPIYAIFGRSSAALMGSAVAVHFAAITLALWMARRFGGLSLMLPLACGFAALARSSGPSFFTEPWNPWFAVFPFAVFLLATWASLTRSATWFVLAIGAGSFCVQCHIGYLVIVAGLSAVVLAVWVRRVVVTRAVARDMRTAVFAGAALLLLMWLPPIIDQLSRTPGNLSILLQNFASPDEPFLPRATVLRVFASELSAFGPWLTGPTLLERNAVFGLATLLPWAVAAFFAWQRRNWVLLRLHGVLACTAALGMISLLRIFGPYQEYTIRWFWVLTTLITCATVFSFWQMTDGVRRQRARGTAVCVGVAVLVGATALGAVQFAQRAHVTGEQDSMMVAQLIPEMTTALDRDHRYLVRWHDPIALGAVPFGVMLELERRGFHPGVDRQFAAAALPQRVLAEEDADDALWVVLGGRIADFRASSAFHEIASADLRSVAQQQRSEQLRAFLEQRFAEIGRPELFELLDAQYGGASLLFGQPKFPDDVTAAIVEFVELRLPAAVFRSAPDAADPAAG